MSAEPLRLDTLLESVADGCDVDWEAAEAAASEQQRRLVRNLRLVAGIAQVHRTVPEEAATAPAPLLDALTTGQPIPRWGHLLLLETIGEGAFGEVYRARDSWLDREVALKLLKPGLAGPARLIAEAQALARVRHANVVTVHGADIHDGRVGLWMDLVRGRTLASIVASDGTFSAAEAIVIGQELCKAVAAVHAAGLVHRDIKAQNVMREAGGRLVLMDFGAGHTPLYLAPELLNGDNATFATDIYAVGVLLYYLVTGKYPTAGASLDDLKRAHAQGGRRSVAEVRPGLPDQFVTTVERALHPDPAQRFRSAWEMQQALQPSRTFGRNRWAAAAAIVAALGIGGYVATRSWTPAPAATTSIRMIAVLPLVANANASSYFADGMTEALMQELASSDTLRVISRTSVDRARETEKLIPAIARVLHADAVLEGAVDTSSDTVRVNLRLIHAGSDTPVWSSTFERPLQNVLLLQREIARAVAAELSARLRDRASPGVVQTDVLNTYFRARQLLRAENETSARLAVEQFKRVLDSDQSHAAAHAGLAKAYLFLGGGLTGMDRDEGYRLAGEHATRAIAMDSTLSEAHAVLAELRFERDWDWGAAEAEFLRTLALDPSLVYARRSYALFLSSRGRTEEAVAEIENALRLDPLSLDLASARGATLRYARRYDDALAQYKAVLASDPHHLASLVGMARTLNAMGRHEEALATYRSLSVRPSQSFVVAEIAQSQAAAGHVADARATLKDLLRNERDAGWIVAPDSYAYIYARLNDRDAAFAALDRAFDRRVVSVLWALVDPRLDPLRSDPRFNRYIERLQPQIR